MSAIKGQLRENKEFEKYVGFIKANIVAINPDRDELNTLFEKEASEDDKPIEYVGTDNEGNDKVRLTFWLRDDKTKKLFPHNIHLIKKFRLDNEKKKHQYINTVLDTGWAEDPSSELPDFFTNFLDEDKEIVGEKKYRKALQGEEELGIIMKAWLGRLKFNHPETDVAFDTDSLFAGNYKELRSLILPKDADEEIAKNSPTASFVALLGVKTDDDDNDKQYQQVFGKAFMPGNFIKYINNGNRFSTTYAENTWKRFKEKVEDTKNNGKHGFKAYYEYVPLVKYDKKKDVAQGGKKEEEEMTPQNDQY